MDEDVQTLLDRELRVEDDEPKAERQHIVARANLEEPPDRFLHLTSARGPQHPQIPQSAFLPNGGVTFSADAARTAKAAR